MNAAAFCEQRTPGDRSSVFFLEYIIISQTCQGLLPLNMYLLTGREPKVLKTIMSILFVNSWCFWIKEIRGAIMEVPFRFRFGTWAFMSVFCSYSNGYEYIAMDTQKCCNGIPRRWWNHHHWSSSRNDRTGQCHALVGKVGFDDVTCLFQPKLCHDSHV